MYIFATFEYSLNLELAITELEQEGVIREYILAVPLEKKNVPMRLFDSMSQSDRVSLADGMFMLAAVGMVFGAIYGYVLKWGPLIWSLLGFLAGGLLGLFLDLLLGKKGLFKKKSQAANTDVVLLIHCESRQVEMVEHILWKNTALGVGRWEQ